MPRFECIPGTFECPETFYVTKANTGCSANSIPEFFTLADRTILLNSGASLDDCFTACETESECVGVAVSADDSCFVFKETVIDLCDDEGVLGSTICSRIEPSIVCVEDDIVFAAAAACSAITDDSLAFLDISTTYS